MTMTQEARQELQALICEAMEQQEQRKAASKTVYRRICADFEQELHAFDYRKTKSYVDRKGVEQQYDATVACSWRIRDSISTLLRVVYQTDSTAKLPPEKEEDMRQFMRSVLELMGTLKN